MTIATDIVFLDIETLPTLDPDLIAEARASVEPPANYSRPEAIEKWWLEKGEAARDKAVRATSLDGGTGRLASLAWAWGSEMIMGAHTAVDGAHSEDQERRLIEGFFAELETFHGENRVPPTLVGHNVIGFDVRWLWKRSIVLGIRPPHWWPVDARPWDHAKVQDTMVMWEGSKGRISQDRLARTLGLGGKGAIDGSMVADVWAEGRFEEIREYCIDDVRTVRRVWCRIVGEDAPIEEDEFDEEVAAVVQAEIEVPVAVEVPIEIVVPRSAAEAVVENPSTTGVIVGKAPLPGRSKFVPDFLREAVAEREGRAV